MMMNEEEFAEYCEEHNLTPRQASYIDRIRKNAPVRNVCASRSHGIVKYVSLKMGKTIACESRGLEHHAAIKKESDIDTYEYFFQPDTAKIENKKPSEKKLPPITHTPEAGSECLSSFLIRNQQGLGVNASQLLAYSTMILEHNEQLLVKSHLFTSSVLPLSLNGDNERTSALCEALSHLQPETDFGAMTLKAFEYKTNGLLLQPKLKKHLHWCSHCFKDWHSNGVGIHYPLIWQLQGKHSCEKHARPLSNVCSHCGMQHKHLNRYLLKGECSRCKGTLMKVSKNSLLSQTEMF